MPVMLPATRFGRAALLDGAVLSVRSIAACLGQAMSRATMGIQSDVFVVGMKLILQRLAVFHRVLPLQGGASLWGCALCCTVARGAYLVRGGNERVTYASRYVA